MSADLPAWPSTQVPVSDGPSSGGAAGRPHRARTRSFTRRGGRMSDRQRTAYDSLAQQYVVDVPRSEAGETTVDPDYRLGVAAIFGRTAPMVVEIGSGSGAAVCAAASARPDWDFLALEVWRPGVAQTLARMGEERLHNIRLVEADAALALATMLQPLSVHEVWTFFPDPWPKTKHHKRRLVDPAFAEVVHRVMQPEGLWRLATDWADYAGHIRSVLDGAPGWHLDSEHRAPMRPMTRFERRGVSAGHEITDLAYRRG